MKKDIHPELKEATVTCNGCNTVYKTTSTVDKITVEICSQCHPFYTGKQKLVDVAGRVDKFKARQAAATKKSPAKKAETAPKATKDDPQAKLKKLKEKLESTTAS